MAAAGAGTRCGATRTAATQKVLGPSRVKDSGRRTRGRRAGPRSEAVAWEWLEHGQRKRGLKHSTLKDYRCLLRNHLLRRSPIGR